MEKIMIIFSIILLLAISFTLSEISEGQHRKAGVAHLASIIQGDAHREVAKLNEPIDLLFIDADKEGYMDYLNKLLPLIRPGGLIVSHNMNSVDKEYLDALTANPDLETIIHNQQLGGVGVTLKKL